MTSTPPAPAVPSLPSLPPQRYFVADVHLNGEDQPHSLAFRAFLKRLADESSQRTTELYVLGDLFDYWHEHAAPLFAIYHRDLEAIQEATQRGVKLYLLSGNRDFSYGKYARKVLRAEVLGDFGQVTLADTRPVWLEHGDLLCTRDRAYLRFRAFVRSWPVRLLMWLLPWAITGRMVARVKRRTLAAKERKSKSVLEIDLAAARRRLEETGCRVLICGHLHEAKAEDLGAGYRLIVLPAWCAAPGGYVDDGRSLRAFTV